MPLPKYIQAIQPQHIFITFGVLTLTSIAGAIALDNFFILILPFFATLLLATLVDFKLIFISLFLLLPISMEMSLPGGIGTDFPSELLMVFLMFSGFCYFGANVKKIDRDFFNHTLTKLVLAHLFWIGLVAILSQIFVISVKYFLAKTWYVTVFVFLGGLFIKTIDDFKKVFWCLLIPMMVAILVILAKHSAYGFSFETINKTTYPFFRNHVNYGVMMVLLVPFAFLVRKWYKFGSIARFIINVGIFLLFVGITFAYTRAAYISLILMPIGYFLFRYKWTKTAITGGVLTLSIALTYLIIGNNYLNFAPDYDKTIYHSNFEDHLEATLALKDLSTMERFYRWVAGINMSTEHVLTGFGPGTFTHFYRSYTSSLFQTYVSDNEDESTVHNYFLLVLIEQGWAGFLIFMTLCIMIFIKGEQIYHETRDPQQQQLIMACLICLLVIMANNFMADLIETDEIGSFFFICMAIIINQDLYNKRNREKITRTIPDNNQSKMENLTN